MEAGLVFDGAVGVSSGRRDLRASASSRFRRISRARCSLRHHVDGSEGKFVQKLKIYAQKQCPVCGTAVAKVTLGGRTSWYCPKCQK